MKWSKKYQQVATLNAFTAAFLGAIAWLAFQTGHWFIFTLNLIFCILNLLMMISNSIRTEAALESERQEFEKEKKS